MVALVPVTGAPTMTPGQRARACDHLPKYAESTRCAALPSDACEELLWMALFGVFLRLISEEKACLNMACTPGKARRSVHPQTH